MSPLPKGRASVLGLGVGVAAAGSAAVAGFAADRLWRAREQAKALGATGEYDEHPDDEPVVIADDGVPLHVEVDEPRGRPSPVAGVDPATPVPTVVFSHGYTLNLRSWVFQRRALRDAGYRVVLWEQRGHGRSGTGSPESYDVDQLGRDLEQVVTQVVPEGPLVLVGHSMGGMTMMALALHRPDLIGERVVGAAFVSTSAAGVSDIEWGLGSRLGGLVNRVGPNVMQRLARRPEIFDAARRAGQEVEEFFVHRYSFASPVPMSVVRLTADMIFGTSMEVISAFVPSLNRHDKIEALERFVGVETLVLNGAQDLLTVPARSEEIVRHIPGAEHVVINEAGHIVMLEHPDAVSDQLLALLARARRAVAGSQGRLGSRAPQPVRRTVTDLRKRQRDEQALPARRRRQHAS